MLSDVHKMEGITDSTKNLSLNIDKDLDINSKPKAKLCYDSMPDDTKYWLCGCTSYPQNHSHTRSRWESFPASRVTRQTQDTDI